MTNREEKEKLVRRWNIDGWGKGDLDAIDELCAPEEVLHFNEIEPEDRIRTPEKQKKVITKFREAMPDFHGTIDHLLVEGDWVAVQVTWEGTHTQAFGDIPPSNKYWRWTDMMISRFENGKLVEASFGSKCKATDVLRKLAGV